MLQRDRKSAGEEAGVRRVFAMKTYQAQFYPKCLLSPLRTPGGAGGNVRVVPDDLESIARARDELLAVIKADQEAALAKDPTAVWLEFWSLTLWPLGGGLARLSFGGVCCRECDVEASCKDVNQEP